MFRNFLVLVLSGTLFLASTNLVTPDDRKSSIEIIISNSISYDGKEVVVEGEVEKIKYTTFGCGTLYTLFRLHDDDKNTVGVYTKGYIQLSEGSRVRVMGKFNKERRYAIFKFKNVIKAKNVEKIS